MIRCSFRHFSSLAVPSFGRVRRLARLSATVMLDYVLGPVGPVNSSHLCHPQRFSDPEVLMTQLAPPARLLLSAWRAPPPPLKPLP